MTLLHSILDKAAQHPIILGAAATVGFCLWLGLRVFAEEWKETE